MRADGGQRLPKREVRHVHPWRPAPVARDDSAALFPQARGAIDEAIECGLLGNNFRWGAAESDLGRVEGAARDVDRVVPNRSVGVEITAPRPSARDISEWESRSTYIEERQLCRQRSPGRTECA